MSQKQERKCVIHYSKSTDQTFTYFSNLQEPETRFNMIKEIAALRQSQPIGSNLRMDNECQMIPTHLTDEHGYHRSSYQRFTKNQD